MFKLGDRQTHYTQPWWIIVLDEIIQFRRVQKQFNCMFMQKCLSFNETWQIFSSEICRTHNWSGRPWCFSCPACPSPLIPPVNRRDSNQFLYSPGSEQGRSLKWETIRIPTSHSLWPRKRRNWMTDAESSSWWSAQCPCLYKLRDIAQRLNVPDVLSNICDFSICNL